jgi:hypothetical protein
LPDTSVVNFSKLVIGKGSRLAIISSKDTYFLDLTASNGGATKGELYMDEEYKYTVLSGISTSSPKLEKYGNVYTVLTNSKHVISLNVNFDAKAVVCSSVDKLAI